MVEDGTFSHKIDYVTLFWGILNHEECPNHIIGSKITAILINGWILPVGKVALGRWARSLRIRLFMCIIG